MFSADQIANARKSADGYLGEFAGRKYYLNIDLHDFRIQAHSVEIPDQMGEGNNSRGRKRYSDE